jgi:hypothetical protein
MPLFVNPIARPSTTFSPIKAHLDDMVNASVALESQLAYVIEDGETYGLITYDTFFENCPVRRDSSSVLGTGADKKCRRSSKIWSVFLLYF